jgi:hypothetical protein
VDDRGAPASDVIEDGADQLGGGDIIFDNEDRQRLTIGSVHCGSPLWLFPRVKRTQLSFRGLEGEQCGTANLFLITQPLGGWRHVAVTERRTKHDFARQMRDLVDRHFPDAATIRVVLDNLNTHIPAALYEAFAPAAARRILRKLDFHYTPVHGSWLNMAERRPHQCRSSTEWRQPAGVYHGVAPRPPARGPCRPGGPAV